MYENKIEFYINVINPSANKIDRSRSILPFNLTIEMQNSLWKFTTLSKELEKFSKQHINSDKVSMFIASSTTKSLIYSTKYKACNELSNTIH